mgnify:CR=1 FL=1
MPLDKPYLDVPGTTIFDAEQSRKGYWLNQFCMSLMKAENRARFKANERAYLDEWAMTEEQKQAVLARDLNWCMRTGGNIYFLAKIGATDGKSFQYMAASMTGMTQEDYAKMMLSGGRFAARLHSAHRRAPLAHRLPRLRIPIRHPLPDRRLRPVALQRREMHRRQRFEPHVAAGECNGGKSHVV